MQTTAARSWCRGLGGWRVVVLAKLWTAQSADQCLCMNVMRVIARTRMDDNRRGSGILCSRYGARGRFPRLKVK